MEITNNSTIDSVIDFANVKFGMELNKDEVSTQLRELTFSETLHLLNAIKRDDDDAFLEIINISIEESYGTISSAGPSRATIRAGSTKADTQNRRANNANQDANRDANVIPRTVAGAPLRGNVATGQGASRVGSADPDDIHRQEIEDLAAQGQGQSNINAQEIERLKQLAMGR